MEFTLQYYFTDLESPIISQCPANITKYTEPAITPEVNFTVPNATDNSGYTDPVICSPASGSLFPIGETQVGCSTADKSGNVASCSFFIDVRGNKWLAHPWFLIVSVEIQIFLVIKISW